MFGVSMLLAIWLLEGGLGSSSIDHGHFNSQIRVELARL